MNTLDRIVAFKSVEVDRAKRLLSHFELEKSEYFNRTCHSLSAALRSAGMGIIAEHKRRSPSKGAIHADADVAQIVPGYAAAGVAGISVLTDQEFFGGAANDLLKSRSLVGIPLLRKEFIIDQYQIVEAKALGADAILLIAAIHNPTILKALTGFAHNLGLEVLLEVHDMEELHASVDSGADMIGVNNRNLKTFEVDLNTSRKLIDFIPSSIPAVAESGIEDTAVVRELHGLGFSGFLIGQRFMEDNDPGRACMDFMNELKTPLSSSR